MSTTTTAPHSNPFATRFVTPGMIPWIGDSSPDELASRFLSSKSTGMLLVGPHGSGKSTLLLHLAEALGNVRVKADVFGRLEHLPVSPAFDGKTLNLIYLQVRRERSTDTHCFSRRVSAKPEQVLTSAQEYWRGGDILLLDGLEQLRPWNRLFLLFAARRAGVRVLATSHQQHLGFTALHRTEASLSIAQQVIAVLVQDDDDIARSRLDQPLRDSFARHAGNMREVLMDMYDYVLK